MTLSVIVPVWNGRQLLERLLATVDAQTEPAGEVLVVDNGSSDGAPEFAARRGARVVPMGRNAGFAAAVNRGILESRGEWIAVLNSDVELEPGYLAELLAAAADGAWFATGKLLAADGTGALDGAFDLLSRGGAAWRAGSGCADGPPFSVRRKIWSAPWTAAIFRAELFRRIGALDESFESYLEDVDFGVRCAMNGCSGWYEPAARAWHRGSASLGRWNPETVRRISRNQVRLLARHYPAPLSGPQRRAAAVAQILWGCLAIRHGRGSSWIRGKWQGLREYSTTRVGGFSWPPSQFEEFLTANEKALYEIQAFNGFELYWKLYFLLAGGGAK